MARQIGEGIFLLPWKTPQRRKMMSLPSIMHWAPCSRRSQTEISTSWERAHSWWFCHPCLGCLRGIWRSPWISIPWDYPTGSTTCGTSPPGWLCCHPPSLVTGKVIQSSVLPKLERVKGVKSCRFCLHPHTVCRCSQISVWSHTSTRQTPATVTTTHSHDSTSVSTLTCPPPGLSSHGAAAATSTYSEALVLTPPPHMRGVSRPPLPGAGYPSVGLCLTAPDPRMEAPIRQEHPVSSQKEPKTPYQQQVQAPVLATHSSWVGRGAILAMIKKSQELELRTTTIGCGWGLPTKSQGAPAQVREDPGQDPQDQTQGRSRSRLWKGFEKRQSQLTPRGGAFPSLSGASSATPVQLGHFHPRHPGDFRGEGWKKDAHWAYLYHISVMQDVTAEEAEALTAPITRHMERNRARWHFVKEEDPLQYSILLNDLFEEVHGYRLKYLDHYTEWIKPRGWCHKVILEKEQLNYCVHLMGAEPPASDVEWLSEATLWSHRAGHEAAKQGGTGKNYKRARTTLLETLKIHGLKEEYDYIIGGEKGPPPNRSGLVPMEVGGKGETAVNQGGGDASLGRQKASWEEQVQVEEEWRLKDNPQRKLPPLPPRSLASASITTPLVAPSTSDGGFITVQGWNSRDKRPRDPSKDPTPQRRPSKASWSPLPFPLKNESERVASIHTLFEAAVGQNKPSSWWVYDRLKKFFPCKTKEQLVYFSNVLCIALPEFHLTSTCSPPGMCVPVLSPVVKAELPPLENYLHEEELESQDIRVCCIAAIKWLRAWLHRVNMTTWFNEARASGCPLAPAIMSWAPSSIFFWCQRTLASVWGTSSIGW